MQFGHSTLLSLADLQNQVDCFCVVIKIRRKHQWPQARPKGRSAPTSTRISRVTKKSNLKQNYFIMQPRAHLCGGQNGTELGPPQLCKYVYQITGCPFCRSNAGSGKSKFSNDLSVVSVLIF